MQASRNAFTWATSIPTRLGPCPRLCGNAVANAATRPTPQDFVIATGRQESVRRFIELSPRPWAGGSMQWDGEGINEVGRRVTLVL